MEIKTVIIFFSISITTTVHLKKKGISHINFSMIHNYAEITYNFKS